MKLENESKKRAVQKICEESEELRQLKEKIRQAYLNKERAAQIAEGQYRKIEQIKQDAEVDDIVLQHNQKIIEDEKRKEEERLRRQRIGRDVLDKQLEEKRAK
mmetsp:Transcript_20964/g.18298  ORF Transcript_20964/g.18298 Transcript_20964/m.18298 type:complete len:103 (-) Transcript_20964:928-1236(-)